MFYALGALTIFLIPYMFLNLSYRFESIYLYAPVLIAVEVLIYFFTVLWQAEVVQYYALSVYAIMMVFARLLLCLLGAIVYSTMTPENFFDVFYRIWVGNPLAQLLQILLMLYFVPHILIDVAPGLINDKARAILQVEALTKSQGEFARTNHITEPLGGFIKVYSFPDLQACFRKIIGLEGFVIYSNEGLLMWNDLDIRFDIENLIIRFMFANKDLDITASRYGLREIERLIITTTEHFVFNIKLGKRFFLLAFFNNKSPTQEVFSKIDMMIMTTYEFLRSRYQILEAV